MNEDLDPVLCVVTPSEPVQRCFLTLLVVVPVEEADDIHFTRNSLHLAHEANEGATLSYLQGGQALSIMAKNLANAVSNNNYGSMTQ